MRVTFGQVKNRLGKVLNLASTDSRVKDYANEAMERLLYSGKWVDTTARFTVCTYENCLTWPRDIETIEAASVCGCPLTIRNEWYEFLSSGPGLSGQTSCIAGQLLDRGTVVSFANVPSTGYTLAVYCDGSETGQILLRYYDSNGNKVYTTVSGQREEGEYITLPVASGYAFSIYECLPGGLYAVIKPETNRPVRLYASKISDGSLIPLAYYEPDETVPNYRSSKVPSLSGGSGGCATRQLTIAGKIRYIPIYNDNSILCIPNTGAVRLACQAVKKEEDNDFDGAGICWALAYKTLNDQVTHFEGDGVVSPIRMEKGSIHGGGGVPNLI